MKALIPAAGMGTRFLPATKAQPKEMLLVVDRPAIQYVVEEGLAKAGRGRKFRLAPIALPNADELPLLPTRLEGALCVAPTERYEGFFVAKVERIA